MTGLGWSAVPPNGVKVMIYPLNSLRHQRGRGGQIAQFRECQVDELVQQSAGSRCSEPELVGELTVAVFWDAAQFGEHCGHICGRLCRALRPIDIPLLHLGEFVLFGPQPGKEVGDPGIGGAAPVVIMIMLHLDAAAALAAPAGVGLIDIDPALDPGDDADRNLMTDRSFIDMIAASVFRDADNFGHDRDPSPL